MVEPPMWYPAMPVEAVTAVFRLPGPRHHRMISRSKTDLPVPAAPVKNRLSPAMTLSRTRYCSSDSWMPSSSGVGKT